MRWNGSGNRRRQARSELDGLKTELRQDAEKSLRLHEALAQEKRRADAAAQELGSMKAQVDALRQSEAKLAEVSAVAEGERRRAEAAALEEAVLKGEQAKLRSKVTELEGIAKRESNGRMQHSANSPRARRGLPPPTPGRRPRPPRPPRARAPVPRHRLRRPGPRRLLRPHPPTVSRDRR